MDKLVIKRTAKVGTYTFHVTETFADDPKHAEECAKVLANDLAEYYIKKLNLIKR